MRTETKVELLVAVLGAAATIAASIIGATWKAEGTATAVARKEIATSLPNVKLFPRIHSKKPESQWLGKWQVCTLITAGESHYNQACTCTIEEVEAGTWELRLHCDPTVDGWCSCRAACFSGLAEAGSDT